MWLKDLAWANTRDGKPEAELDWDELCVDLNARVGGKLGRVAHGLSRSLRGSDASVAPDAPRGAVLSISQWAAVGAKALARVHEQRATFSRADLLKAVSSELPPSSRRMDPSALVALVCELADRAIAGEFGPVLPREAPEWPAQPDYLRRAIDGRSVYTRPGADRYASGVQLSMEEQLLCAAQCQGAACLSRADAARLLGADAGALDAVLRESVRAATDRDARVAGLRLDQAASAYHLLTSSRTVEVLVGPAGSGKTRTLASVAKAAGAAGRPVLGLATSQAGRNALADAGVPDALNTAQFLGHGKDGERGVRGIRALAPGTFILLDEASMTSTADLRDLAVHAARNGHKLIVSGDHAQLSAVESGGGMSLLVDQLGHVELGEAVRFAEPWEQDASLRLRQGDVGVLAVYDDHGRIRGNSPAQAMEDARRLYVGRYVQGHDVELIIASNALSHEMARRIRDDLQHLGIVSDGPEVQLADGARASAGDVIIARDNDHRAGVANSDVLRIEAIYPDGTITVRRRLERDKATGQRRWAADTFTYRGYATADLAYGATAHTKQGKTVTATVILVTGNESAEWLYSAMTRGTASNIACVFTHPTGDPAEQSPRTRPAAELARADLVDAERNARSLPAQRGRELPGARDGLAVLADITARRSAELSATTMGRRNLAHADHLAHLHAIWQGETTALSVNRYRQAIREALPAAWASDPLDSPQATWLWRALRQAEAAGLDARDVARRAIEHRPLDGTRDLAAVLDARIRRDHPVMVPAQWRPWAEQVPEAPDAEQQGYLGRLAAAMDARKERLGAFAAEAQPAWVTAAAGPVPADPAQRAEWERRVSHVGAYRELYGWDHPTEPVGPEPSGDTPEKRAAWHAAYGAMTRTEGIDLRDRSDGNLHLMRDTYRAETEWAPPHVADELRAVRHGRTDMAAMAARAGAMADAARKAGDEQLAARHEQLAAGARFADGFYAQIEDMDAEIMAHRAEWARVTEGSRHLAVLADAELRRRYPGDRLDPLRSAEPDEPASVLPDPAEPSPQITARLAAHKETTAKFRARLEARQGVRIPNEDPDYQYEGEAWPSPWQPWDRDAVLKPPQPEIRPALEVERLAAARDAEYEAGL